MTDKNVSIDEVLERKTELQNKKLKHREVTDLLMKESLDRLSVEERYYFLYYYIMNDVFIKADS